MSDNKSLRGNPFVATQYAQRTDGQPGFFRICYECDHHHPRKSVGDCVCAKAKKAFGVKGGNWLGRIISSVVHWLGDEIDVPWCGLGSFMAKISWFGFMPTELDGEPVGNYCPFFYEDDCE